MQLLPVPLLFCSKSVFGIFQFLCMNTVLFSSGAVTENVFSYHVQGCW